MTPLTPELSQLLPELSQLANTITRLTILYEVTRMANEPSLSDEERWICFGELSSNQPLVTREPRSSFKLLPQPQRQRGRRPTYDYTLINEELLKIAIEKGWPYFRPTCGSS